MRADEERNRLRTLLFFLRWQLWPVLVSLPGHLAFVLRGLRRARCDARERAILAARLIRIHLSIPCLHAPLELLCIVEEIIELSDAVPGVVVECGAYLGGGTAKLSQAARQARRRLLVCDSFEGLPPAGVEDEEEGKAAFEEGAFAAGLEEVRSRVRRHGFIDAVEFVPGWYNESLSGLAGTRIACVLLDVDLQESIRTCLLHLWKDVEPGCKVFVHDVSRPAVTAPFRDREWWQREIGTVPPEFVGEGTGLGRQKRLLGYAVKADTRRP